jgi:hypothetical protein
MNYDIESYLKQCRTCEKFQRQNSKESLMNHEIPMRAFHKIGIDFKQKNLIVVDYFSKWLEIIPHKTKTINEVICNLKRLFATFGIPAEIVCDNVPFNSRQFHEFAKEYDFEISHISPKHSRSNGMVEKAVHIASLLIEKCKEDNTDLYSGLLEYRNTPLSDTLLSPAELMFNRLLRTKIPVNVKLLNAHLWKTEEIKSKVINSQIKQRNYYNVHAKDLPKLKINDQVTYYNHDTKLWQPAKVVAFNNNPRSYKIQNALGNIIVRNRKDLRFSQASYDSEPVISDEFDFHGAPPPPETVVNPADPAPVIPEHYTSRVGRPIIRPRYLNEYV